MKIHYYYYYYSGGLFCIMTRAADPQSVLYNGCSSFSAAGLKWAVIISLINNLRCVYRIDAV